MERPEPQSGMTGSASGHRRLAIALPVRSPEESRAAPLTRHVSTTHLRRFVMLMQYESAVVAERHTGVKAASIHYAVHRLEDRLGTVLFTRSASSIVPTAAAERLFPCAIRLLSMWDRLVEQYAAQSHQPIAPQMKAASG